MACFSLFKVGDLTQTAEKNDKICFCGEQNELERTQFQPMIDREI